MFQTATTPSIQFLFDTSTIATADIPSTDLTSSISTFSDSTITIEPSSTTFNSTLITTTTEQTTTTQNSTHAFLSIDTTSFNNETSPSNEIIISSSLNNLLSSTSSYSTENNPIVTHEQINNTTENIFNDNSTIGTFIKANSELILNLLNRTRFHSKNLIYNTTAEEAARHLSDRRTMQSLIHLIPPHLWSQLQSNFSTINFNQSQYMPPSLPDPVILAEAAAQAGLPAPGPYPIPEHLWHQPPNFYRNPPQIINNNPITKPTTTCKFIFI